MYLHLYGLLSKTVKNEKLFLNWLYKNCHNVGKFTFDEIIKSNALVKVYYNSIWLFKKLVTKQKVHKKDIIVQIVKMTCLLMWINKKINSYKTYLLSFILLILAKKILSTKQLLCLSSVSTFCKPKIFFLFIGIQTTFNNVRHNIREL